MRQRVVVNLPMDALVPRQVVRLTTVDILGKDDVVRLEYAAI